MAELKVGAYAVLPETIQGLFYTFTDAQRVRFLGIPKLPGDTPADLAKAVLRANAGKVLIAGTGHFRFMWPSDFGKAFRGAEKALEPAYLRGVIAYMIRESGRLGRVTSCFTPTRGFDMPYYRGDNLPWLIDSVAEYGRWTGDKTLVEECRPVLQTLLDGYERDVMDPKTGLVALTMTGDWMDTILRPSSTYNNLCALHMLKLCGGLGLKTRTDPSAFEKAILKDRWRGDHFTDYSGTEDVGVDAGVVALYFELFDAGLRDAAARYLEASPLVQPVPIKVSAKDYDVRLMPFVTRLTPKYHSSIWLHSGLMYLNGLKKAGRDVSAALAKIEALFMKHRNIIEAVDDEGRIYQTPVHSCEHGLSMAAGQYLELAP